MTSTLWNFLRPYRWRLGAAVALQALGGLFSLLPWVLLAWWADELVQGGPGEPIHLLIPGLVGLAILCWLLCQPLALHLTHLVDIDVCNDLRRRLLKHLQALPLDWFSRHGTDGVTRLAVQDVRALHQLVAHAPNDLCNLLIVPLIALLLLLWLRPGLLLFCLVPLLLSCCGYMLLRSVRFQNAFLRRDKAQEGLSVDYGEFSHNLLLVRQYPGAGAQRSVEESANEFNHAFSAWVSRVGRLAALIQILLGVPWLMAWVTVGAMILLLLDMPLAVGEFCAFLLLVRAMAAPVQALGHGGDAVLTALAAAQRLQDVFDQEPLVESNINKLPADGSVSIRSLHFSYQGRPILSDINLDLSSGSLTALVGPSGSGKTTLLHLLARHMDPQVGSIRVGGIELRNLPEPVRHRYTILVAQQAAVLELSLAQNIALLRPDADLLEIRQAAREVCLDEHIASLPRGYDSVPGQDLQLSGGEMQRVAMARALLSRAPLVLFDEPTSALDPQTAGILHRVVRDRMVDRTRLVVSHTLSDVIGADHILVLDNGRVVEHGIHAELVRNDGAYARLWHEQQNVGQRV